MAFWQSSAQWARKPCQKKLRQFKASLWILAEASPCRACLLVRESCADTLVLTPLRALDSLRTQGEPPHVTLLAQNLTAQASTKGSGHGGVVIGASAHHKKNLLALKPAPPKDINLSRIGEGHSQHGGRC